MIELAWGFIHSATPGAAASVTLLNALNSRLTAELDADNEPTGWYTWGELAPRPHRIKLFHLFPFQNNGTTPYRATMPTNIGLLQSRIVSFGSEVPTRPGRAYNWLLSRAVRWYGCEVVVMVTNIGNLTATDLAAALDELSTTHVLVERNWGKILTRTCWQVAGELREDLALNATFTALKTRLTELGYTYG